MYSMYTVHLRINARATALMSKVIYYLSDYDRVYGIFFNRKSVKQGGWYFYPKAG